jgi:hypothetical protein
MSSGSYSNLHSFTSPYFDLNFRAYKMVLGHDIGPMPLTAIWALHLEGQENQNTPWRAVVAHWKKIDYEGEKRKKPPHPEPDYMGDILDPRSAHQFPKNIIPNATVEGRLLGQ